MAIRVLPFDEQIVLNMLSGALSFLNTYRNTSSPNIINSNNDLISETFHSGYFNNKLPTSSSFNVASAYGQTSLAYACFYAYRATKNSSWLSDYAFKLITAYTKYFFIDELSDVLFGNDKDIWVNHWLCVSKGSLNVTEGFQDDILDPYSYGNFDTIVSFSNGVGVIPNGTFTSKVYKIYETNSNLLFKNVYSPIEKLDYSPEPKEYFIDYYVSNYMLTGVKYRFYNNGNVIVTNEIEGTVKLIEQYTGNVKVVWSNYIQDSVYSPQSTYQGFGFIETYPMLYKCKRNNNYIFFNSSFLGMYSAYDAFKEAYYHSNYTIKWDNAINLMGKTIVNLLTRKYTLYNNSLIYTYVYFYKKENVENPLNYSEWKILSLNDDNYLPHSVNLSRETNIDKLNTLKINILDNVNGSPKVILENNIIKTNLSLLSETSIEIASDINTLVIITFAIILKTNNIENYINYSAYYIVDGDSILRNIVLKHDNFINWSKFTLWYPTLSDVCLTPFNTDIGTIEYSLINDLVPSISSSVPNTIISDVVLKINLTKTNTNNPNQPSFVLNGFITETITILPKFFYKYKDNGLLKIVVTDEYNNIFVGNLPNTNNNIWLYQSISWSSFSIRQGDNTLTQPKGLIKKIEFELVNNNCEFYIYCIGQDPVTSSSFELTSVKTTITDKNIKNHTLWIGDFKTYKNTTDINNKYYPGSVPFSNQIILNNNKLTIKNRWLDNGHNVGYLSPYHLRFIGYSEYANNQIKLIEDSQTNYFNQSLSRLDGLLTPLYINDNFSWKNVNDNITSATYNILPFLSISKYLKLQPDNEKVKNILIKFLKAIEPFTYNSPITKIVEKTNPISEYENPTNAALIGLIAINTNILGIEPYLTISIIKNCYQYLVSQYQNVGNMTGSFSYNQKNVSINNTNYKEYTTQYHADSINFLSNLIFFKDQLNIPATVTLGLLPNIVPTLVKSFKEAPYPKENLVFSDGNRQVLGYQKSKRGRIIEITYSAINAIDVQRLGQFWQLEGGVINSFTLPTTISAFSRFFNASWRFQVDFKFEPKVSTKNTGAYDVTIILEQA